MKEFKLRLLCIDTAIKITGYAVYYVCLDDFSFKLVESGIVDTTDTDFGNDTDSRVRSLMTQVSTIACRHSINCYIIEEPPETIYGWSRMTKVAIVGRASKMFKVVGAVYALVGMCFAMGVYCRVINPVVWQRGAAKAAGMDSKSWSLAEAKKVLAYLKINKKLKKKDDENIADAINIGVFSIKKFAAKEWELPSLVIE